jgi:hypothetical protein
LGRNPAEGVLSKRAGDSPYRLGVDRGERFGGEILLGGKSFLEWS